MNEEVKIDKRLARRAFDRAAQSYDEAAILQREVNLRLLERFDDINFVPESILDIGAGTGFATYALHKRFPKANVTALDIAESMLAVAKSRLSIMSKLKKKIIFVNAEAECLPFADNSMDLIYSNLTLQWVSSLDAALQECRRVLKPGGMLLFSTFGPDTLKELRHSWQAVDQYSHVNDFIDMHDVGDAMMRAQFAEPVMDVENFTLTYSDVYKLMHDLKAIGAHNVTSQRAKGLTGKTHFKQLEQHYETFRQHGVLPASYEVVYGHAWLPVQELTNHKTDVGIPFDSIKPGE
ncbi:Malonyl-[acyl-carrier protein] O-methyltransferase [hydrothermal vent metagenome]|uniref:malonyl-[acyl-carrier protein] O-methyltransferase n=1 Tax=hydrothermal vent metagenome TaxID=652676 RepID=A0A3B1A267_9ZZZZ